MTDARFPERWLNDRRVLRLPDDAFRLFVNSLAWSVANRTDGVVYDDDLPLIPGGHPVEVGPDLMPVPGPERHLVKAGLWARIRDYWQIAEFDQTQTTSVQLKTAETARRADRDRKRRERAHAAGDHSLCDDRPCAVHLDIPADVQVDSTRPGQARPGPEQQPPTNVGQDGQADRPQCIVPGCEDPARRGLKTCWGHAEQEPPEEIPF